jgi:hypothetical protein
MFLFDKKQALQVQEEIKQVIFSLGVFWLAFRNFAQNNTGKPVS